MGIIYNQRGRRLAPTRNGGPNYVEGGLGKRIRIIAVRIASAGHKKSLSVQAERLWCSPKD